MLLFIVMITSFIVPFMTSALNLSVPTIGLELNCSAAASSWIVSVYLLISAAFLLPFGRLSDIIGQKKIYLIGILLTSIFSLLCGLSWSLASLLLFRLGQGLASAMIFSPGVAIITAVYPVQQRGKMLGLTITAVYLGLALGPVIGGFINYHYGWRCIFWLTSLVVILISLLGLKYLKKEWISAPNEKLDYSGSILYILAISLVLYGFSAISTSSLAKYLLLAGLILLSIFAKRQMKQQQPLLDINLCRSNLVFTLSNLSAMINYSATFGIVFLLSLFLQIIKQINSQTAGLILLIIPAVMIICAPLSGALSDRVEARILSSLGMFFSLAALFLLIFLSPDTSIRQLIIIMILIGIGTGIFTTPNTNAIMSSVPLKYSGVASSTMSTMRLIGQAVSMAVVTLLLSFYEKNLPVNENILPAIRTSAVIFSFLCCLGIFTSIFRGKSLS
ncbi:MAG: MFS transporter [bacterium]